jgi:hypothetical protein
MSPRQPAAAAPYTLKGIRAVLEEEKTSPVRIAALRNPAGASTAAGVMKHVACGAGAATARSSKGGKSGGGLGGQQAGGVKGGGKRKTHAGRK